MAAAVTVVVVTYRSAGTIGACLRSIAGQAGQIVVVDNDSPDDSVALARACDATVVERRDNGGFAVAANEGLAASTGDWVLFLNPDTECPPGTIDRLLAIGTARPDAGLISAALDNPDGTSQPIIERKLTLGRLLLGLVRVGGAIRPRPSPADGPPIEVDWVHGAAVLMPLDFARQLGGWDTRFFLYGEDADLCARVWRADRSVLVAPDVRVAHVGGASFSQSMSADEQAALRVRAVAQYLDLHSGRIARRLYMTAAMTAYGLVGHRAQARAARAALR